VVHHFTTRLKAAPTQKNTQKHTNGSELTCLKPGWGLPVFSAQTKDAEITTLKAQLTRVTAAAQQQRAPHPDETKMKRLRHKVRTLESPPPWPTPEPITGVQHQYTTSTVHVPALYHAGAL